MTASDGRSNKRTPLCLFCFAIPLSHRAGFRDAWRDATAPVAESAARSHPSIEWPGPNDETKIYNNNNKENYYCYYYHYSCWLVYYRDHGGNTLTSTPTSGSSPRVSPAIKLSSRSALSARPVDRQREWIDSGPTNSSQPRA